MSEVKDPAIKLFGRTIPLPLIIPNDSSSPSPSSSPPEFLSAIQQESEEPLRKELITVQDDDTSQQTKEDLNSLAASSAILENSPKTPSAETENSLAKASTNGVEQSETSVSEDKTLKKPDKIIPCPRCNSMDTKFCYFNNYNVNQPRHFCKKCQRYWTAGGTMRNVPVGAGRRKNKTSPTAHYRHLIIPEGAKLNSHGSVLAFDSDSPLCNTMASVLNIAERTPNCVSNGFHPAIRPNTFVSYSGEDDHSVGVSVTTSTSSERKGHTDTNGSVDKRLEGFPPQLQYIPSPLLPYPWNSAMPPPTFCPPNYPLAFYPPPAYWGCLPPPWNMPCISPKSPSVNHSDSAHSSVQYSPTLGKHSRDGNIITSVNSQKEKPDSEHNSTTESSVLIPKTLRFDDPNEAAKSSLWSKLGISNDKPNSLNGGSMFNAFQSKGKDKNHSVEASPLMYANPAALSRSRTFHEGT